MCMQDVQASDLLMRQIPNKGYGDVCGMCRVKWYPRKGGILTGNGRAQQCVYPIEPLQGIERESPW